MMSSRIIESGFLGGGDYARVVGGLGCVPRGGGMEEVEKVPGGSLILWVVRLGRRRFQVLQVILKKEASPYR